jgi:hypothetical protein
METIEIVHSVAIIKIMGKVELAACHLGEEMGKLKLKYLVLGEIFLLI